MAGIRIHDKTFVPFITASEIQRRVSEIGASINADYAGKTPLIIGILNGAFIFTADIFRELTIDAGICFTRLKSYSGLSSTGNVEVSYRIEEQPEGRHVIVVEDIIDTGKTLHTFLPQLMAMRPASLKVATFLTKPSALRYDVHADYTAFEIEDKFVVGYGLDYDGLGRNLPDLYILEGHS